MDEIVTRSMAKWPDVPDVYGWLRLDRRGNWRLRVGQAEGAGRSGTPRFEPIANPAFNAFIGRNYAPDDRGCWFFQNGPQRVFVGLAYAPMVFHIEGTEFVDHCGRNADPVDGAWLDEEGTLVIHTAGGAGGVDDRDLLLVADGLGEGILSLGRVVLPVGTLRSADLEAQFGFVRAPKPRV
jgi:hypothetical protein